MEMSSPRFPSNTAQPSMHQSEHQISKTEHKRTSKQSNTRAQAAKQASKRESDRPRNGQDKHGPSFEDTDYPSKRGRERSEDVDDAGARLSSATRGVAAKEREPGRWASGALGGPAADLHPAVGRRDAGRLLLAAQAGRAGDRRPEDGS